MKGETGVSSVGPVVDSPPLAGYNAGVTGQTIWRPAVSHRLAVCGALAALACSAGEIEYHASFEAALEAAGKSKQLVMVVVVAAATDAQGRDFSKMLREETLSDAEIGKVVQRHFAPFLLDLRAVNEKKQAMPEALRACFKPGEPIGVPQVIFLDAKGKEVDRLAGYAPPINYLGRLKATAEKALALIPDKDRRDALRALERGKQAVEKEDFAAAYDALNAALGGGIPQEEADAARRLLNQLEAKATQKLDAAAELEGKNKLGSAIRAYQECARSFKGTEAARKAGERLVEIRKDPELRKRLNAYMAARLLANAQEAIQQKRFAAAAEALDAILRRYGDSEEAAEAKKLQEQLKASPEAAGSLRDARARSEAERLLSLGDGYRRNKMPDKALAEYRKVLEKFPDTTFAQTAKARIAELAAEE